MRLLYLSADPGVPVLGHKGASVHVRGLVEALRSAGVSVTVVSPRTSFEGDVIEADVQLVGIDPVAPKIVATVHGLRRAMRNQAAQVLAHARRHEVDGIYERHSLFSDAGVLAAQALGIPHILEVNAPLRDEARRFRTLPHAAEAHAVEAAVFAATDHAFVVSNELRNALVDDGLPEAKIEVLPNGVDPAKFAALSAPDPAAFTAGFCGSPKPWHGVDVLAAAFAAAAAEAPQLRLEVVGAGAAEAPLVAAAAVNPRVALLGALPHRAAIAAMSRWHVGVAPYLPVPRFYFSPLKVLEYMAAGVCVVASDLGQIRALLGGGERGVLVAPGDPAALAAALRELTGDRERALTLGRRARHWVLANHTWAHNAERVLRAFAGARRKLVA
jgi:glycosyltransferase involved in cell wall biosynthesis